MKVQAIGLPCLLRSPGDYGRDGIAQGKINTPGSFRKLVVIEGIS